MEKEDILLAEYQAANNSYMHYDSFRWQAGSLLIAGVFVFWGVIIGSENISNQKVIGVSGLVISMLMGIWLLFAYHYRQLYLCKIFRMHKIENQLGMQQHLRFVQETEDGKKYKLYGPKGHNLDIWLFSICSLGGSLMSILIHGYSGWLLLPAPIVFFTIFYVVINEKKFIQENK